MNPVNFFTFEKWATEEARKSREWATLHGLATPKELDAYEIGVKKGHMDALATLKLHRHVEIAYE